MTEQITTATTVDPSRLDQLVAAYLDLEHKRADIEEQQDAIKAELRTLTIGAYDTPAGKVTVSPNRRFDPKLAEQVLAEINPDLIAVCSSTVLDSKKVKASLAPAVYERCMRVSETPKVAIA